jgi:hypothetical protein
MTLVSPHVATHPVSCDDTQVSGLATTDLRALDTASDTLDETDDTGFSDLIDLLAHGRTLPPEAHWRDRALCHGRSMFPDTWDAPTTEAAKAVCGPCPVAARCLVTTMDYEAGASTKMRHGIAGGATPAERWGLRHHEVHTAPRVRTGGGKPPSPCGTQAAWERHRRNGEDIDDACQAWRDKTDADINPVRSAAMKKARALQLGPAPACGTLDAWLRHRGRKERVCGPCKEARTRAANRNVHPPVGTDAARDFHRARREGACEACKAA